MAHRLKLKVKTGCTTCRVRKVKCDEAKPFCNRCKTSGRRCGGYATGEPMSKLALMSEESIVSPPTKVQVQKVQAHSRRIYDIHPLSSLPLDVQDGKWLHFFSSRTGPALTPFSDDNTFWSKHVPLLGVAEPAVRHALLAVAFFHARFETMHGAADAPRPMVGGSFTINHYNLAIDELRHIIDNRSSNLEVPLICCLLFVLLECLYGNYPLVLAHLRNGLNILSIPDFHLSTDSDTRFVRKKLQQIFNKLLAHSTLFGAPARAFSSHALSNEALASPAHGDSFADVAEAKSCLDIIISLSLNFVKSLHDDSGERKRPGAANDQPIQQSLKNRLISWEHRLEVSQSTTPQRINPDDPSVLTLKIEHRATLVYLSRSLKIEESSFDMLKPDFIRINNLCRSFIEKKPRKSSGLAALLSSAFSLDSGCVSALFLTAYKCRDPTLRREAVSLLETYPCREGMWDAALHAKIGRRVIEIEEASMLRYEGAEYAAMEEPPSMRMIASSSTTIAKLPLERFRIYNIRRTSDDLAKSARVTFFTAPYGYDKERVIWSEDFKF